MPWKYLITAILLTPLVLLTSTDAQACQPIPNCTITSGNEGWPSCQESGSCAIADLGPGTPTPWSALCLLGGLFFLATRARS